MLGGSSNGIYGFYARIKRTSGPRAFRTHSLQRRIRSTGLLLFMCAVQGAPPSGRASGGELVSAGDEVGELDLRFCGCVGYGVMQDRVFDCFRVEGLWGRDRCGKYLGLGNVECD